MVLILLLLLLQLQQLFSLCYYSTYTNVKMSFGRRCTSSGEDIIVPFIPNHWARDWTPGDDGIYDSTCMRVNIQEGTTCFLFSLKSSLKGLDSSEYTVVDHLSDFTQEGSDGIGCIKMNKLEDLNQLLDLQNTEDDNDFVIRAADGSVWFLTDIYRGQNCCESFDIEPRTACEVSPCDEEEDEDTEFAPSVSDDTVIAWFLRNYDDIYARVYNYDAKYGEDQHTVVELFVRVPADETFEAVEDPDILAANPYRKVDAEADDAEAADNAEAAADDADTEGEADATTPATKEIIFYSYNVTNVHNGYYPHYVNLVLNGIEVNTWV